MNISIEKFTKLNDIAVVGVSSKKKKFGNYIYEKLLSTGYNVYAVNPKGISTNEILYYKSLNELENISSVVFVTKPDITNKILRGGIPYSIKSIWIQQGAGDHDTEKLLRGLEVEYIFNKCLMMHLNPVNGIHKFHKIIDTFLSGISN